MISYEKYSTLNLYSHTNKFAVVYKIGITAGLTSTREVAALFSHTRIQIFKIRQSLYCLLGVVTEPTDSRLSDTSTTPFLGNRLKL